MSTEDWTSRKAKHSPDPFADEERRTAAPSHPGVGSATATCRGVCIATSSRIQIVNKRAYIPICDCDADHFVLAAKRWR